jgi:hypothetical protein
MCSGINATGHADRGVTVTFWVARELYMGGFIVFVFLGLDCGKIDTRIESVASVLNEKRLVTEIVKSQSLSRSRASYT